MGAETGREKVADIELVREAIASAFNNTAEGESRRDTAFCAFNRLSEAASQAEREHEALQEIERAQPQMLATLRKHGIVFDGPLGNDPKNWQHVAFSIYTALCEVDFTARAVLAVSGDGEETT